MFSKANIFFVGIALCISFPLAAQQSKVDSLKPILAQHTDSSRIQYLMMMGEAYMSFSPRKAIEPANEARTLAIQAGDEKKEANAFLLLGKAQAKIGKMEDAIVSFSQAEELMRKVGTDIEVGHLLIEQGNAYNGSGSYDEALTVSLEAYTLFERSNDKHGMARALTVSGNVYHHLGNDIKAVADYEKALAIARDIQDAKLVASNLGNIGSIYVASGDYNAALSYYLESKEIREQIGDKSLIATSLNSLGGLYLNKAQDTTFMADSTALLDTALYYYLASLEIRKQTGDQRGILSALANIGGVMLLQNNPDKGIEYYQRALDLSKELQALDIQMVIFEMLHEAYVRKNDIDKALAYYKLFTTVKDSIYTSDMSESIAEMQARFDVEKAEAETRATEKQKKIILWSSVIGGILLVIIIFFIWRQSSMRKKTNVRLNQQKAEIEFKNVALNAANLEIELKNKDITDSIRYARRIQEAILPEMEFATTFGKSGFVLYRPKDIVSGDFYWMARKGECLLFAAVDCTGHGVPGAFVSIVCSNLLNQAVNEHGLIEPHDILNDVNGRLSVTLRQRLDESKVRDGMDIALCRLNTITGVLSFAGAFNPAWIFRNGEMIELKADKFAVGNFEDEDLRIFARQETQLMKGDRIYVFSDGFSDQFGGPDGKKYKRGRFINFLQHIQKHPLSEHRVLLEREHLAWRGNIEQIDDIVVMAMEYPIGA